MLKSHQLSYKGRIWLLISLTVPIIVLTFVEPPIAQDPSYHQFADQRTILGITNFFNVVSNLGFLLSGIAGLLFLQEQQKKGHLAFIDIVEAKPYTILFWATLLTSFGSAYYHLVPNDTHLVLDRLPMTFAFMAFFSATIMERINLRVGLNLLTPLIVLGVSSVVYWYLGDLRGGGDLRFYIDIQFYPLLAIPLIIYLFSPRYLPNRSILLIILLYLLAKLFELYDKQIFSMLGGVISGHTIKHLVAGLATYAFVWILNHRYPAIQTTKPKK